MKKKPTTPDSGRSRPAHQTTDTADTADHAAGVFAGDGRGACHPRDGSWRCSKVSLFGYLMLFRVGVAIMLRTSYMADEYYQVRVD
jgi:hypothetical protein